MTTYLEKISTQYNAETHHAFVLHGATRDLQLGEAGSCSLVDHLTGVFSNLDRLVAVYRVGTGWSFAVESDKRDFRSLVGFDNSKAGDFAALANAGDESDLPLDTATAIGLIDVAMRQSDRAVILVIDRAELVCPQTSYDRMSAQDKAILSILQALASDRAVESTRNLLILITDSLVDLHESLRLASSRYYAIEIMPPDYDERLAIAQQVLPQLESSGCEVDLSSVEFSSATSMMTRYGLMDILLDAKAQARLTKEQVRTVKAQVMSQEYGDILEVLSPLERGFADIAGLYPLKTFFQDVVSNMIGGNLEDVPAGVLLAGAAGLGKTHLMRGLAGESGLPVINFNVGRLLGSYVGQSERNLERALTAIRSAAPCMAVLDEIETTFPDRSTQGAQGDSGIGQRILKRMLEELSDPSNRGRVCWIGITNFPQKLDAALSRAGRFDVAVAFLPPTLQERIDLILLYCAKYGLRAITDTVCDDVAATLTGYTNAEIENCVRKARQICLDREDVDDCGIALRSAVLRVRANTRDVQSMTDAALLAVNDSDMIPSEYIERWKRVTGQIDQDAQASAASKQVQPKKLF